MNRIIIFLLALTCTVQSCYKDHTSGVEREISNIEVDLDIQDKSIVDLRLHEELLLAPQIKQNLDLPVTYEWEVDFKLVSTDKDYKFSSSRLGTFPVRLKVSNEDGSTFKEFTIRVNSQYEEGLMILSEDANQEGVLGFIPKSANELLSKTAISDVETNSFEKNNPGLKIGLKPTDIAVRQLQVFVSSEEGGISMLNYKTLELEGVVRSPDFPDFKPVIMNIQDNLSRSALIQTRSGRIFSLATLEYIISNHNASRNSTLDLKSQFTLNLNYTNNFFWDAKESKLWNFRNTAENTGTTLAGQNILHFLAAGGKCYVLTADKNNPSLLKRTVYAEDITLYDSNYNKYLALLEQQTFTNSQVTIKPTSVTLLDDYYQKVVYANSNKIYKWFYSTNDIPSEPFITLDIPGEVTCMEKDPAKKEMYVGVYDANASGLKGSIVVYDLDSGAKKATFPNITGKPVKLFFKIRK